MEAIIRIMVRHRVLRVNLAGTEIELSPLAFVTASAPEVSTTDAIAGVKNDPDAPDDLCPCGHSLFIMHGDGGCYEGCSLALCASSGSEPDHR